MLISNDCWLVLIIDKEIQSGMVCALPLILFDRRVRCVSCFER